MTKKTKVTTIILWIARILGSLSLLFLVFMVGAHLIEAIAGKSDGTGFASTREIISFLFFPVSTIIGLSLALKWEGLGGLITALGIISFHLVRPDIGFVPMIDALAAPGFIYCLYWFLTRTKL